MKILNRKIHCTYQEVDINDIAYLPFNPRLLTSIDLDEANQEIIHSALSKKTNTDNVAKRIIEHGGLLEDIWVLDNKTNKIDNTDSLPYVVLEGNTRTNIYKRLCSIDENKWIKSNQKFNTENYKKIPCRIIHDKLKQNEIEEILEELHDKDKGKGAWELHALARYYRKKEEGGLTTKQIQKEDVKIQEEGGKKAKSSKEINDLIATDRLMDENDDANTKQFQHYFQVQKSEKLRHIFRKKENELTAVEKKIKNKIKVGLSSQDDDKKIISKDIRDVVSKSMAHPKIIKTWASNPDMTIRELQDELELKTGKSQVVDAIKRQKNFWDDNAKTTHLIGLSKEQRDDALYLIDRIRSKLNKAARKLEALSESSKKT